MMLWSLRQSDHAQRAFLSNHYFLSCDSHFHEDLEDHMQFEYGSPLCVMVDTEKGFEQFENVHEDVNAVQAEMQSVGKAQALLWAGDIQTVQRKSHRVPVAQAYQQVLFSMFCIYAACSRFYCA